MSGGAGGRRRILPILAVAAVVVAAVFYFLVDPAAVRFAPQCLFRRLTGFDCPGCGTQRMLHALLHGDLAAAWGYNPLSLIMLPVLLLMGVAEMAPQRFPWLFRALHRPVTVYCICAAVVAWGVTRNFL